MALIRKISILSFALLLFACGGGSGGNGGGGDASTIKLQFDDVVDQDGNPRDFIGAIHGFLGLHEHNLTNFGTKPITINKIILRTDSPVDQLINEMLIQRQKARSSGDFTESDRLRDLLAENGISVNDGKDGQNWNWLVSD